MAGDRRPPRGDPRGHADAPVSFWRSAATVVAALPRAHRQLHAILTATLDIGARHACRLFGRVGGRESCATNLLPLVHSIGLTLVKIVPVSIALALVFTRPVVLLVLQSGAALVAQARPRHRPLLLVHHPAVRALSAHRPPGDGRRVPVRHQHRRRSGRVLRRRPRPAGAVAALAAGGHLPGRLRLHDVLDPPRLPPPDAVALSRRPSFLRASRLDFGGAVSSDQHLPGQRGDRRRAAAGRHFAECAGLSRAVHDRAFGLRARQPQLDARAVQIRARRPGLSSLAPHRRPSAAARRTLRRPFRSSI